MRRVLVGMVVLAAVSAALLAVMLAVKGRHGRGGGAPAGFRAEPQDRGGRDFERERRELVLGALGGVTGEDGTPSFFAAAARAAALSRELEASPVLEEARARGEDVDRDDLLRAAWGGGSGTPESFRAEGRRVLAEFVTGGAAGDLDRLAGMRVFLPPSPPVEGSELADARAAFRLNAAQARTAWADGDDAEFVRSVARALGLVRALSGFATMMASIHAESIEIGTWSMVLECVVARRPAPEVCAALSEMAAKSPGPEWTVTVRGEELRAMDLISRAFAPGGLETSNPSVTAADAKAMRAGWAPEAEVMGECEEYFGALRRVFDPDRAGAEAAWKAVQTASGRWDEEKYAARNHPFIAVAGIPQATVGLERHARCTRAAAAAVLACERWYGEKGAYPDSLAELVPGFLGAAPVDWFAPDRSAIRYRRVEAANDRLGRSYLVYSVGADGVDHGGREDPLDNFEAAKPLADGIDLVFNWRAAGGARR